MANTVSILTYTNTFGDWVNKTNALANEVTYIGTQEWTKTAGTLKLNGVTTGLQVANNAIIGGQLQVQGPSSSAYIQKNITVDGLSYLNNTVSIAASSSLSGLLVTQSGTGVAFKVSDVSGTDDSPFIIDASGNVGIGTAITDVYKINIVGNSYQNGNSNISGTNYVNIVQANTSVNTATLSVVGTAFVKVLQANTSVNTSSVNTATLSVVGNSFMNIVQANTSVNTSSVNTATLSVVGNSFMNIVQANTSINTSSVNTATLSVVGNSFMNIVQANTSINTSSVNTATLSVVGTAFVKVLQANTSVNTSSVNTATLSVVGNSFMNIVQANTSVNTSSVNTATLSVVGNSFMNIVQANTSVNTSSVNTATLSVVGTAFVKVLQANTSVNTSSVNTATLSVVGNSFMNIVQANTSVNTAILSVADTAFVKVLQANTSVNSATLNVADTAFVKVLQANTSVNTATLSVVGTAFVKVLQANTSVNTAILSVADTAFVKVLQANTSVNTSSITASALGIIGTATVNVLQANTSINTSSITASSLALSGQLSVNGNFVISGTTVYNSSEFTLNSASIYGLNSALSVNRGASGANSSIRWNETNRYWDIRDVVISPTVFTGSIIDTGLLTVTAVTSGTIIPGMAIYGAGINNEISITSYITGTGGIGTYNTNQFLDTNSVTITGVWPTNYYRILTNQHLSDSVSLANSSIVSTAQAANTLNESIISTNTSMKSYVDASIINMQNYVDSANTNMQNYVDSANTSMKGYVDSANSSMLSYVNSANSSMKNYVDSANTSMKNYVNSANSSMLSYVNSANSSMKNYVDTNTQGMISSNVSSLQTQISSNVSSLQTQISSNVSSLQTQINSVYYKANTTSHTFNCSTGTANPLLGIIAINSTNGIVTSAAGNTITINTPQDLRTTASPTFAALSLTTPLPVTAGGTGFTDKISALQGLLPTTIGIPNGYVLGTSGALGGTGGNILWVAGGTGGSSGTVQPGTTIDSRRIISSGNSVQTIFNTLPVYTAGANQLRVYINGVRQFDGFTETSGNTNNNGVVTFSSAPATGDSILFEVDGYVINPHYANNITITVPIGGITSTANTIQLAIQDLESRKATLVSPTLTGNPLAPTAAVSVSGNTQIATTAFVYKALANTGSTYACSISGVAGNTEFAATFSNAGGGVASGTSFDGSSAKTISYNTIGAAAVGQTTYIGTTAITLNRSSLAQGLTGITSIDGTAAGLSATLISTKGGTGTATTAIGDLLQGAATNTWSKLASVAVNNALISGGVGAASSWGKIGLGTHVSGLLPISNGGTNSSATATDGGIVYGDGLSHQVTSAGTAGQILTSAGGGIPSWSSTIKVSNGTALAPSIAFTSAANTGFYSTTSGYTNFANNGAYSGSMGPSGNFLAVGNITSYGSATAPSDIRLKTNITKIENALDKVLQLNGYTFDRIDRITDRQTGVIAQEVQKVLPEAIVTLDDEDKTLTVAYGNMVGLLIEAIKELSKEIDILKGNK